MIKRWIRDNRLKSPFIIILWIALCICFVYGGISRSEAEGRESSEERNDLADAEGEQVTGSLKGIVKNLTTDKVVPQQKVILYTYRKDAEVGKRSVVSDSAGAFEFSKLQIAPLLSYRLMTRFQDADYSSALIRLTSERPEQTGELKVYSSSDDDSKIQITAHHLVIKPIESAIQINEYIILENDGNTSYLTSSSNGNKIGLRLELPNGFKDFKSIQGLMEHSVSLDGDALLYSRATLPGRMNIIFSYQLPAKKRMNLSRRLSFNTNKLLAMVAGEDSHLTSSILSVSDETQMQGKTYTQYIASDLNKGQAVDIQLELPNKRRFNPVWLLGIVLVVGLAAILVVRRLSTPRGIGRDFSPGDVSVDDGNLAGKADLRRGYLELISKLDEMYEADEIAETAYKKIREEQKAKLGELISKKNTNITKKGETKVNEK